MTPTTFISDFVLPTVHEARDDRLSQRRAYLACIAVFHIKDHLKAAGETGIETTMRTATGDLFDVVRSVCNGTKHVQTDHTHRIPFAAGDDQVRPPGILGTMQTGRSNIGDTIGGRDIQAGATRYHLYASCVGVLRAYALHYPQHFVGCDLSTL